MLWNSGHRLTGRPSGDERARRRARLQQVEATFDAIAFDAPAARSYGQVIAAVAAIGRTHRRRVADLLVAATARANGLPLHTRNPADFDGLGRLIEIIGVREPGALRTPATPRARRPRRRERAAVVAPRPLRVVIS